MSVNSSNSWTINDLNRLIADKTPESLTLDYKASASLKRSDGGKKELAKDVSSFANSAGGRIIFGIPEQDNLPQPLDSGVDDREWSRESIEQVIDSNVSPRIRGLAIHPIPIGNGRSYYVIDIPQANDVAPHQVISTKRYYKLLNFTTAEMEDYEIRDAMRRSDSPNLYFDIELSSQIDIPVDNETLVTLSLSTRNESRQPATYALMRLAFEDGVASKFPSEWAAGGKMIGPFDGQDRSLTPYRKHIFSPNHAPLYKEEVFGHGEVQVHFGINRDKVLLIAMISCPGCMRTQAGHLGRRDGQVYLELYGLTPE